MRYIQRGLMYGHVLSVKRNLRHITRDEGESGLGKTVRLSINSQVPIFVFAFVFVFFFFFSYSLSLSRTKRTINTRDGYPFF